MLYEENELYAKHLTAINGTVKTTPKMTAGPDDDKVCDNNVSKEVEMAVMNNGNDDEYALRMTNVYAKWSENSGDDSLSNLNVSVKKGQLLAIIGPVGAGKVSHTPFAIFTEYREVVSSVVRTENLQNKVFWKTLSAKSAIEIIQTQTPVS